VTPVPSTSVKNGGGNQPKQQVNDGFPFVSLIIALAGFVLLAFLTKASWSILRAWLWYKKAPGVASQALAIRKVQKKRSQPVTPVTPTLNWAAATHDPVTDHAVAGMPDWYFDNDALQNTSLLNPPTDVIYSREKGKSV